MTDILNFKSQRVTIIGGAKFSYSDLDECLSYGSTLISADGGANQIEETNYRVHYIIGDMDSIKNKSLWKNQGTKVIKIDEQETTDFEKCL